MWWGLPETWAIIDKVADTNNWRGDIQERYALLTPQERGQLVNALNEKSTQERLSTTFPEGTVATILNKPSLSENDRKIVNELLAKLYPEKSLQIQTEKTNKPSTEMKKLLDGLTQTPQDITKLTEFSQQSPEKIKELFKNLNKWDLVQLGSIFNDGRNIPEPLKLELEKILKPLLSLFIDTMLSNGFSIENTTNIAFLKQNGSEAVKTFIADQENTGKPLEEYKNWSQLIFKVKNGTYSLEPAIKDKKLPDWLDITRLNTINIWSSEAEVRKSLGEKNVTKESLWKVIKDMEKYPELRSLNYFLQLIGKMFGMKFDDTTKSPENPVLKEKEWKQKFNWMLSETWGKYSLASLFNGEGNLIDKESKNSQEFLSDLEALWFVSKKDGKLTFDDSVKENIKAKYKALWWTEGKASIPDCLKYINSQYDEKGERLKMEDKRAEAPIAPAVAPAEKPKYKYAEFFAGLEWKNLKDIRTALKTSWSSAPSKADIESIQQEFWFSKNSNDKATRLDGDLWPATIREYFKKYNRDWTKKPEATK